MIALENKMTLSTHQLNPVASCGAILIAAVAGLCVDVQGQVFLGEDPIQASPKTLAADRLLEPNNQLAQDAIEIAELKAALGAVQKQVDRERDRASAAEAKVRTLSESLAEANRIREEQVKAHNELQLKMQAFGVDLFKADPKSVEQRLLKSVRELDVARGMVEKLSYEITSLSESLVHFMQLAQNADAQSVQMAESVLKSANQSLGLAAGPKINASKKLKDAKVVSIDPEVGLIVVNVGRNSGARIGMPIEVLRTDRPIGTAMVVDVRDGICGAVLQEMLVDGDDVKVGDGIRPQPEGAAKTL